MPSFLRVVFTTTLLVAAAPAVFAQPKATLPEPIKDFEIVSKGDVIVHDFAIRNEGDAPLEILDVRPACGCTVADYTSTIAPGESGTVHAEVETSAFNGPIAKPIAIFTNDPENPKLQLVVKAHVKPYIAVVPGYARFIYVQHEETGTLSQSIFAEDGSDIAIVGIEYPEDLVSVEYREAQQEEKVVTDGRQWKVDVTILPDSEVGALREMVKVKLDHPKQQEALIPISGFVRPRQHLTPYEIDIGTIDSDGLPYARRLDFTNFITQPVQIQKIETGIPGLTASAEASEKMPGHRYKINIEFGEEMAEGEFESEIRIHIDDPKNPVVLLPIKGTIL